MPLHTSHPKPDINGIELIYYDPENQLQFDKLPDWIKKKINEQGRLPTQYNPISAPAATQPKLDDDFDDDIPF